MREIAIEGNDGAGKTSVVDELARLLRHDGESVVWFPPFRKANELLGQDVYELWRNSETVDVALCALSKVLQHCRDIAERSRSTVIIYDRHWMSMLTELSDDSRLDDWAIDKVPAAYLRTNKEVARKRAGNDLEQPWMNADIFDHYQERFEMLARQHARHLLGIYRSDDDVTPLEIARSIHWDMGVRR